MADAPIAHYHNTEGLQTIRVGSREFMCIGATPPYDHPHIFLDLGSADEKICPYCSTLYVYDSALKPGTAEPASALWSSAA